MRQRPRNFIQGLRQREAPTTNNMFGIYLTYKQLVDDTRRDLAMRHLDDPRHSITDVTFLLGFSQQSAFTRAFKRWTGMSPSEYRAQRTISA